MVRMAQTSGCPQEGQSVANPRKKAQGGAQQVTDTKESCLMIDSSDAQQTDHEQQKMGISPEVLPEDILSRDKYDASWYHGSFTKSLQKAEALLRLRFNPSLKWLLRQKSDDSSWDFENQDTCASSSVRLQRLEQSLLGLGSQCHVLRESPSPGRLQGCARGLSCSTDGDFYHHPQAAAFSQHYAQLQHLLEQRAQLLFLHEYTRRSCMVSRFVDKLTAVLERTRLLLADGGRAAEQPNSTWSLGLGALCRELRLHVSHWDLLCAKVRLEPLLRCVLLRRTEMLGTMRRSLRLQGLQALLLMERCTHTALSALATAQLASVPRDALEDLLSAVECFNHIVENQRAQPGDSLWRSQVVFMSDWPRISGNSLGKGVVLEPYPVVRLMRILAKRRAQMAAEHLYLWTSQQSNLRTTHKNRSQQWEHFDLPCSQSSAQPLPSSHFKAKAQNVSEVMLDGPPNRTLLCPWSSDLPFSAYVRRDRESLEILFQALVSSTDLLAPHVLKRPPPDRTNADCSGERCCRAGEDKQRPLNRPRMDKRKHKAVQWMDLSKSEACLDLFTQYRDMLWKEFGKTVVKHFYCQPHNSAVGSVNQWSDQVVFILTSWLCHACEEGLIPTECKAEVKNFCSQMLTSVAFMHWDEVMCLSLGSGLKDKCVPGAKRDGCAVTATMDHILQLFPSLLCALKHLPTSESDSGDCNPRAHWPLHLGLLSRSVAAVQSGTFWIMSKAYQFLSSWSLCNFLLVTQGDLKVFSNWMETLAQQAETVDGDASHPLIRKHAVQLTQGVADLQAFSEMVLRIFSTDCKKMSEKIFEQTMPSAKHWRVNCKTELPSSPSEYAASAAQTVIGQVLEGVQSLPDEARVPALTEATTAFMEAWMEHILRQKIKFSIQGALQLKQDFDLIRDLIRSEEYRLSDELHQQLLALRVFHQVDGAILCLLQQPMAKPYLPSRAWDSFRRCCPKSAQVVDQAASSLNNLESMDIQAACQHALSQAECSLAPELLSAAPPESYLAVAQQEWLDLRSHSAPRWRIPGLHCFTKSES